MKRRRFVAGSTVVCLTAIAVPALVVPSKYFAQTTFVRKSFAALSAGEIDALKVGIAAMKGRPPTDPTSWTFQAAIHGTVVAPANPAWNQCQHGTPQFFSWHRMFLYWFERILRKASDSSALTLPYWHWLTDSRLPQPFRDTTPANSLFHANRGAGANAGNPLPASSTSVGGPMGLTDFFDFQGSFEGTPHGSIHGSVGGDMGSVPRAAQDPIFWLHHCMIDRAWGKWLEQGGGRANPSGSTWLGRTFPFFDENGAPVTQATSDVLETRIQLAYVYDRDIFRFIQNVAFLRPLRVPPEILEQILRLPPIPPIPPNPPPPYRIGPDTNELRIRVPIDQARLRSREPALRRLPSALVLSGIEVEGAPVGYFEVYLNLPRDSNPQFRDLSYVGNLDFFAFTATKGAHEGHGPTLNALAFDLGEALGRLKTARRWNDRAVDVVFARRGADTGRAPDQRPGSVTIGQVRFLR